MYSEVSIAGAHTEFGVMSLYAVELLLAAALIGGSILDRKWWTIDAKRQLPVRLGGIVLIVAVLGTAFADRSAFSLSTVTHLGLAYALFVAILIDRVSVKHLLFAFVVSLAAPFVLGLIQVFGGSSPANSWLGLAYRDASQLGDAVFTASGERVLRTYGSFPHPNVFGGFLGVGLFAWWAFMAQVKSLPPFMGGIGGGLFRRKMMVITSIGTVVLIIGMLLTGSRSAFLGLFVGLALVFVVKSIPSMKIARPAAAILGIVAVFGSLLASFYLTDLASSIRGGGVNEERSLTERIALYEDFVPFMASTNLVVGHGLGSYVLSFSDFESGKSVFDYQPVHNVFLLILAELGFLGLAAMLCWGANVAWINVSRFPHRDALYAFGMGNVVFMICFFDHYLWSSWSGLALIAFAMGMMVRLGEEKEGR